MSSHELRVSGLTVRYGGASALSEVSDRKSVV